MLDILLSSGLFYKQYHNLKMFILFPKLSDHFNQLRLKNYSYDIKIKFFDNMANMYATSFKSKSKVQNYQNNFNTV